MPLHAGAINISSGIASRHIILWLISVMTLALHIVLTAVATP